MKSNQENESATIQKETVFPTQLVVTYPMTDAVSASLPAFTTNMAYRMGLAVHLRDLFKLDAVEKIGPDDITIRYKDGDHYLFSNVPKEDLYIAILSFRAGWDWATTEASIALRKAFQV